MKISCTQRRTKPFTNQEITWEDFCKRIANPLRTNETIEEYFSLSKAIRNQTKDHGGYVFGHLKNGKRNKGYIECRSAIVLDLDEGKKNLWEEVLSKLPYRCLYYTTHSHTPENPRMRIVIPLAKDISEADYKPLSTVIANQIGVSFDKGSFEAGRLMYWPTVAKDGEYKYGVTNEKGLFDPTPYLAANRLEFHQKNETEQDSKSDVMFQPTTVTATTTLNTKPKKPKSSTQTVTPVMPQPYAEVELSARPQQLEPEAELAQKAAKAEHPLQKPGVIGLWCKAHSINDLLEHDFSDIYEPSSDPTRFTYKKGEGDRGACVLDDGWHFYSHHNTDPLYGQMLNAFDLYRLLRFGYLDEGISEHTPVTERPSYKAMLEHASNDPQVKELRQKALREDFKKKNPHAPVAIVENVIQVLGTMPDLNIKTNKPEKTLNNLNHIVRTDIAFSGLCRNELTGSCEIRAEKNVPWRKKLHRVTRNATWDDEKDLSSMRSYIANKYGLQFSRNDCRDAINTIAQEREYNPLVDYLNALPAWDGVPRIDDLLINCFAVDGSEDYLNYVRAVTRKTLCAGIKRAYEPGCKFDTVLVLCGAPQIGKSTLLQKLAVKSEWFTDSLSLEDFKDKTAAEKMCVWIVEFSELDGIRQTSAARMKRFVSSQNDKFRAAYARGMASDHFRSCIFFATTNEVEGYLQDTQGNRRFWPVKTPARGVKNATTIPPEEIAQIWAEAKYYEANGESLTLSPELEAVAQDMQTEALDTDARLGYVQEFLEKEIPTKWKTLSLQQRLDYFHDCESKQSNENPKSVKENKNLESFEEKWGPLAKREWVSIQAVWCECFNKPIAEFNKHSDRDAISRMLEKLEWEKTNKRKFDKAYGKCLVWERA